MLELLPGLGSAVELIGQTRWQLQPAFMPHGMCYLWEPGLVWLHVVSDSLIALAYYSIPALLVYFVSKRRDVPFPWIFWLFGAFIIACGSTHLMEVWTLWHPDYWVSGFVKAFTAAVSLCAGLELVPLIPQALALPSPAQLEAVNRNLENQILERQKMESALRQSEARYRAIVEDQTELICRFLPDGTLTFVNEAYCRYFQKTQEELIGQAFILVVLQEDWQPVQKQLSALSRENPVTTVTHRVILQDGEVRTHQWIDRAIFDERGCLVEIQAVGRDITERVRAEAALRESEERFRSAFECAPIGKALVGKDGRWLQVNPAVCKIFGYSESELLATNFQAITHPDDLETDLNCVRQLLAGEISSYQIEKRYSHKLGRAVPVLLSVSLVRDMGGNPLYFIAQMQDITAQKQAEAALKAYAAQLEASNRELQDFAYVASHDLQEPLRKIQTFGDRLKAKCFEALSEQGRDYLERMLSAASRMQTLIDDLLALARVTTQGQPFVPVNLAAVVREVLSDLEVGIELAGGRVETEELPEIEADPTQMRQLLQNLIDNALKFHRPGEAPAVKIRSSKRLKPEAQPTLPSSTAEVCQITVEDNGIGFDEKYLEKIFLPFERLHSRSHYSGTGIGLALCRKIAGRHGGSIAAKSTPGKGATFTVTLPLKHAKGEKQE